MSRAPFVFIGSLTACTRICWPRWIRSGDLLAVPLALELGHDDLVDVEEAVLLEADLDERGLHAGQDVVDRAEVDVPGDRAALGPLEVDLGDPVVLEQGDALLADVDRDQELALRLRERRAPRRLPAALAAARALPLLRSSACARRARRRRPPWRACCAGVSAASPRRRRLAGPGFLPSAAASASPPAALLGASPSVAGVSARLLGLLLGRSRRVLQCGGGLRRRRARPCVVETGTRARIVSPRVSARGRATAGAERHAQRRVSKSVAMSLAERYQCGPSAAPAASGRRSQAAAGRSRARRARTARSRWVSRAHAHGSSSR